MAQLGPDGSVPHDLSLPLLPAHLPQGTPSPAEWPNTAFARSPVGTGPFRRTGATDHEITLEAWPQRGLWPRFSGYRFHLVPSNEEGLRELRAGKLDGMVFTFSPVPDDAAWHDQGEPPTPGRPLSPLLAGRRLVP